MENMLKDWYDTIKGKHHQSIKQLKSKEAEGINLLQDWKRFFSSFRIAWDLRKKMSKMCVTLIKKVRKERQKKYVIIC